MQENPCKKLSICYLVLTERASNANQKTTMTTNKTETHQMTQTEVLQSIKRLFDAGCLKLSGATEMDRAIFTTNLTEAIAIGDN